MSLSGRTILFLVTEDWYFCSHRLPVARAAQALGAKVVVATRVADHAETIKKEGFDLYPIPFDRSGLDPIRDLKTLRAIIKCYKLIKPDLVHHVALKPALYGAMAAKITNVPAVVNAMAGLGFMFISESTKAKILRPLIKSAFKWLNNRKNSIILLQNKDDAKIFENDIRVKPQHIKIIPGSGIDVKAYKHTPEPKKPIIATCVSRMLWDKGIGELVNAARLLKSRNIPITIQLVGPTDDNPASIPQTVLDSWQEEGIVEVHGPSGDVNQIYADSHIAVLPSYREGLPKSLLEAASCGKAIVATDVPGCREICREDETGLLVPVKSVTPLADALQRLCEDDDLRTRLGAGARKSAETDFAEEIIAKKTTTLYHDLLKH